MNFTLKSFKNWRLWTSSAAQWLKLRFPVQGVWVWEAKIRMPRCQKAKTQNRSNGVRSLIKILKLLAYNVAINCTDCDNLRWCGSAECISASTVSILSLTWNKQTASYFPSKHGFIENWQRTAMAGLQPCDSCTNPHTTSTEKHSIEKQRKSRGL